MRPNTPIVEAARSAIDPTEGAQPLKIPAGAILDRWSEKEWDDGVQIEQMAELEQLAVRTRNSVYEITVLNGYAGEVLVRGGEFFPVRTAVRLEGSTLGGSILKWRGIYVGLQMEIVPEPVEMVSQLVYDPATGEKEILSGPKVLKTSPVQSIAVVI
ncbi:MAG: hypothetical protein WBQ34_09370 [Candidatus Acidiferrales bacterium]